MEEKRRRPGFLYMLHDLNFRVPTYKIGASEYPSRRLASISSVYKTRMELSAVYETGFVTDHLLEMAWHRFFRPKRLATKGRYSREWFHLTDRDVRLFRHVSYRVAKRLMQPDGLSWWQADGERYFDRLWERFYGDASQAGGHLNTVGTLKIFAPTV